MQAQPNSRGTPMLYVESQLQLPEALFSEMRQVF